jgi:hypothetical protein
MILSVILEIPSVILLQCSSIFVKLLIHYQDYVSHFLEWLARVHARRGWSTARLRWLVARLVGHRHPSHVGSSVRDRGVRGCVGASHGACRTECAGVCTWLGRCVHRWVIITLYTIWNVWSKYQSFFYFCRSFWNKIYWQFKMTVQNHKWLTFWSVIFIGWSLPYRWWITFIYLYICVSVCVCVCMYVCIFIYKLVYCMTKF